MTYMKIQIQEAEVPKWGGKNKSTPRKIIIKLQNKAYHVHTQKGFNEICLLLVISLSQFA